MMMELMDLPAELVALVIPGLGEELEIVSHLAGLRLTCTCFRSHLERSAAWYFQQYQVASWEQLAVAIALDACALKDGGNRVGFRFASIAVALDADDDSDVRGSQMRIRQYATILKRHPRASALVDAHTGPTAPPAVAQRYSKMRARLVVDELKQHGVSGDRLTARGHGKKIAASAAAQLH